MTLFEDIEDNYNFFRHLLLFSIIWKRILSSSGDQIRHGHSAISWWTESKSPGIDVTVCWRANWKSRRHWIHAFLLLLKSDERKEFSSNICITPNKTHVSHVEGYLKVLAEMSRKFRIHGQHIQKVVPMDFVKIAISQCSHVTRRLPYG